MKIRNATDLDVSGKRVLLRLDLNLPMENGEIADDAGTGPEMSGVDRRFGVRTRRDDEVAVGQGRGVAGDLDRGGLAHLPLESIEDGGADPFEAVALGSHSSVGLGFGEDPGESQPEMSSCTATWSEIASEVEARTWWSFATGAPQQDSFALTDGCRYDRSTPPNTLLALPPTESLPGRPRPAVARSSSPT